MGIQFINISKTVEARKNAVRAELKKVFDNTGNLLSFIAYDDEADAGRGANRPIFVKATDDRMVLISDKVSGFKVINGIVVNVEDIDKMSISITDTVGVPKAGHSAVYNWETGRVASSQLEKSDTRLWELFVSEATEKVEDVKV